MARNVLIEGSNIHVENGSESVGFRNFVECLAYTGINLSAYAGKKVTYEPLRGLYEISDGVNHSKGSGLNSDFETLLANIGAYKARISDQYFGATLERARGLKLGQLKARNDEADTAPINFTDGNIYKYTEAITNTIRDCELAGQVDSDPLWVNEGKWDNVDGTESIPFTLGKLKDLFRFAYKRGADNYQVFKAHAYNILSLTTVEAVKNYDMSGGWQ